ncbi:MAG TPA: histidinol-phosphate transaminase [Terriglobales bacterium]|nr:histidinol-phosphate transaminase [Terriglobales bacterium]
MDRFFDLVTANARASGPSTKTTPEQSSSSLIKLNANESVYGPSPKAVAAMRAALENSHLYPDNESLALRQKLAHHHSISPGQILIANGTTALLGVIARTLLQHGQNAITSSCSFISYPAVTQAVCAQLIEVPLLNRGFDLEAILKAIDANTRVVFIANPNNPTGTVLDAGVVDRFLERVPAHVVVVLDEAYFDYAQYFAAKRGVDYSRSLDYVRADRNVMILRTFSKAHGLAGIRVGYAIAPAELTAYFAQVQDVFAVSSIAQAAAIAAMDDTEHIRHALQGNDTQATWMEQELTVLGYEVIPTWTNFVALDVGDDAREFARRLRGKGALVRPLSVWGAPKSIRVTLGTPEQNRFFVQALASMK